MLSAVAAFGRSGRQAATAVFRGSPGDSTKQAPFARAWHDATGRRWGHNIKAPGVPWTIYHPHVQEPEKTYKIQGQIAGPARYVPKNFRHQQHIESIRSGEYLGPDWPFNYLNGSFWNARRYNVTYNPIPPDTSSMTGVTFFPKSNFWVVEWHEQEKQRVKWFNANMGFMRAKGMAENYRKILVQAGRVDNRRTERQIRLQHMAGRDALRLRKKKFAMKDARRRGNSGTKKGQYKKVREDYKKRGLLP